MTALRLADDLALPVEAVTQTFALLAVRGSGKTYTAAVLVEELVKAGQPVVVVDPIGVWWGLRADAAGTGPGLPVAILGGDHADLPLDPGAGDAVAAFVADAAPALVLDLSLLRKGEQQRFVTAFAERLYHSNRRAIHLVLDEADAFAPQRTQPGQQRMLGAMEDLVRRGRARGIGVTMITQRPAVLHKDLLTQIQVLVCLRLVAPQDRQAVDAWVRANGTDEQRAELMASLASLAVGEAWVWSPGWLGLFERVKIRRRETFDSSATPKAGERKQEPRGLASVDLDRLKGLLASAVERAEADDPKALRRRIAELEKRLASSPKTPAPERVVERVEVPVVPGWVDDAIEEATSMASRVRALAEEAERHLAALARRVEEEPPASTPLVENRQRAPAAPIQAPPATRPRQGSPALPPPRSGDAGAPSPYALKLLDTLARHAPMALTRPQLAVLSRSSPRSSSYQAALAELKRKGLVEEAAGAFRLTDAGLAAASVEPREGLDVLEAWRAALPRQERALLDALVAAYPDALDRSELAERSGYSQTSSSFQGAISSLSRNALIDVKGQAFRVSAVLVREG